MQDEPLLALGLLRLAPETRRCQFPQGGPSTAEQASGRHWIHDTQKPNELRQRVRSFKNSVEVPNIQEPNQVRQVVLAVAASEWKVDAE